MQLILCRIDLKNLSLQLKGAKLGVPEPVWGQEIVVSDYKKSLSVMDVCNIVMELEHCACFNWGTLMEVELKQNNVIRLVFDTESE